MNRLFPSFILSYVVLTTGENAECQPISTPASSSVSLRGESTGGVLTLMPAPGGNYPYVAVTNTPGEPAVYVITKLAEELTKCSPCEAIFGRNPVLEKNEERLVLMGGGRANPSWILGGTEEGFNIPPAATAVSASYRSNQIVLRWISPPGAYDSISISFHGIPIAKLAGTITQFVYGRFGKRELFPSTNVTFLVQGSKHGTPSNGVGIGLRNHVLQELLMNAPFSKGIAPGFQRWHQNARAGTITFEQGNLPGMAPGVDVSHFRGKGFYQIMRGQGTFSGGVLRRFLGLRPGHVYRVGARLNTLESKEGKWAFTFHAAYNPASGRDLTPAQMAGEEPLPNGTKGKTAGQIARYDATAATAGKWVERFSNQNGPDNPTGDVALPATGSDSITIWFRLEGKEVADVAVGFDSVTIEDLGQR